MIPKRVESIMLALRQTPGTAASAIVAAFEDARRRQVPLDEALGLAPGWAAHEASRRSQAIFSSLAAEESESNRQQAVNLHNRLRDYSVRRYPRDLAAGTPSDEADRPLFDLLVDHKNSVPSVATLRRKLK